MAIPDEISEQVEISGRPYLFFLLLLQILPNQEPSFAPLPACTAAEIAEVRDPQADLANLPCTTVIVKWVQKIEEGLFPLQLEDLGTDPWMTENPVEVSQDHTC
jgi:hypothetical protein